MPSFVGADHGFQKIFIKCVEDNITSDSNLRCCKL